MTKINEDENGKEIIRIISARTAQARELNLFAVLKYKVVVDKHNPIKGIFFLGRSQMTTFVGKQSDFSKAMIELLELEYDANEAYAEAIAKLENSTYKAELTQFKLDHDRHLSELTLVIKNHDLNPPIKPDIKVWLTKGKVILASLVGDLAILTAMQTNEVDTNTAYERMNQHEGLWADAVEILRRGWEDEKRHKAWLEQTIAEHKNK